MMFRCSYAVLLMLFVVSSTGCNVSLQSSQFTFVKNLLKAKPPVAEKNWQVTWGGRDYLVYAVNHSDGIYFANESGLFVSFEGSQVTRLSLPSFQNKTAVQITKMVLDDGTISLQFQNQGGRNMGSHLCSSWQSVVSQNGSKGWKQECADGSDRYTNEIRANDQWQIVSLKQVVVPGVAPIVIAQRF